MESQQQCTKSFLLWSIGSCDRSDQVSKHPPERLVWSAPSQTFTPGGPRRHLFDHNGAGCSRQTRSDNILIADPSVCPRGKARFSPEIALFILWGQSLIALIPLLRQSIVLLLPARGKSGKEDYQLNLPHALPPRETGWQNWIT